MARLNLAIQNNYRNQQGEQVKDTQWYNLIAWEKQAEYAEQHFVKGSYILRRRRTF